MYVLDSLPRRERGGVENNIKRTQTTAPQPKDFHDITSCHLTTRSIEVSTPTRQKLELEVTRAEPLISSKTEPRRTLR